MKRLLLCSPLLGALVACSAPGPGPDSPSFTLQLTESAAQEVEALGLEVPVTGRA
jgi:hypothetical protein